MRDREELVGRGWSFPVRINHRGGIMLVGGHEKVVASLRMILGTALGERVMRPEFGCAIWDLLFEPVNPTTIGSMVHAVREAVARWEPRIDVENVVARPDAEDATLVNIEIDYVIRATNDRRNLVFPFYVIPREAAAS